jgi:hypothetical protein
MIRNWSIRVAFAIPLAVAMTSVAPSIATAVVRAEQPLTATGETGDVLQPPTGEPGLHNPWG